jgi:hypothetical protein
VTTDGSNRNKSTLRVSLHDYHTSCKPLVMGEKGRAMALHAGKGVRLHFAPCLWKARFGY